MINKIFKIITCSAILIFFLSCSKPIPQRPIYKGEKWVDSNKIKRLNFNEVMAHQADLDVENTVRKLGEFKRLTNGTWIKSNSNLIDHPTNPDGEIVHLDIRVYNLDYKLLTTYNIQTEIGKSDLPIAISDITKMLQHNEEQILVVPWYAGYGVSGNKEIEPFQNIIIELKRL